jgi:class 3 adenylate cyclase
LKSKFSLLIVFIILSHRVYGEVGMPNRVVIAQSGNVEISLNDSNKLLVLTNRSSLESILSDSLAFGPLPTNLTKDEPRYVWIPTLFINTSNELLRLHIKSCNFADSVWLYAVFHDKFLDVQFSGNALAPSSKDIPSAYSYLPIQIPRNDSILVYIQLHFSSGVSLDHSSHVFAVSTKELTHKVISIHSLQSFYGGVMLVFCLVSIFMFISFKEREFIYFGILMLSFVMYYLSAYGLIDTYAGISNRSGILSIPNFIMGFINFSMALFVVKYTQLKKQLPKYTLFYIWFTVFTIASAFIIRTGHFTEQQISSIRNIILILWMVLTMVPVIILSFRKDKTAKILLFSMLTLFFGALLVTLTQLQVVPQNKITLNAMQFGSIIFSGMLFYGLFNKINGIKNERLAVEIAKQKSDELLFNILPADIAEELKNNGVAEARSFENVSVLFTDFKGFTETSEKLSPVELVRELNIIFSAFDEICATYHIEKIKTIGDAYMAAAGLSYSTNTFAKEAVLAALDMAQFVDERFKKLSKNKKLGFQMRVGIHSGPVVAGIVGTQKFQYDIWGDSVNTAARMESQGEIGRVNISQTTYEILKDETDLVFEYRGKISAKGKGEIDMYFVSLK